MMSVRLEQAGKTGVGHNMIYDSYWPGGTRNTAWWKNVVGLLTEAASVRRATPIYIEPGELRGGRKGFPEYGRRSNFPSPWPGGWWRLRDIMDYEEIALRALIETTARFRPEILSAFYQMGRKQVELGKSEAPYAFLVPAEQHDPVAAARMVDLLLRHGIRVERAEEAIQVDNQRYAAGTYVIPAAQPYRAFLLTMLRPQRYPEVLPYADGPIIPPYDVTSWSLPLSMGVEVAEAEEALAGRVSPIDAVEWPGGAVDAGSGDSAFTAMNRLLADGKSVYWLQQPSAGGDVGDIYLPAGEVTAEELSRLSADVHVPIQSLATKPSGDAYRVQPTRVGLYKPWLASMDEGWTRWLFEQYEFPHVNLVNQEIKEGAFAEEVDVVVFPDISSSIIKEGKPSGRSARFFEPLPPEYAGGIEKEGGEHLKKWVREGGAVIGLDASTDYLVELFELPVTNVLDKVSRERFNAPGTMLRLLVDTEHPMAYGMRPVEAGYFSNSRAFSTRLPGARFDRRVVATHPEHDDEILVSGYLKGAEMLERRAAVVDFKVGKGRVVLIGFRAQHRAQPHRTFKLLFNALYLPKLESVALP
jgi:hypothetical protein